MTWRCLLRGHQFGAVVARGDRLHVQCLKCLWLSTGIPLDRDPGRARLLWLRRVFGAIHRTAA